MFNLTKITYKHLLYFLLTASTLALVGAYSGEYIFDLQPCLLCLYQRKPFFAILLLAISALFIPRLAGQQKTIIIISILLLFANAALALYHVGVEQKIFYFSGCFNISPIIATIEELQMMLSKTKAVRCDQPAFIFLNISMAGWNVIYCIMLAILAIVGLSKAKSSQ